MISIVDYGVGNIQAFLNVYKRLNVDAEAVRTAAELREATRIILPGVGSFDHAMELLEASGMREVLDERVLGARVPVLGVCVGMQMLGEASTEGVRPGLGWIAGQVRSLAEGEASPRAEPLPLPHMGWNDVSPAPDHPLFDGMEPVPRFYFLHSYVFDCRRESDVAAVSTYGQPFSCAVSSGNIHGVQFHPEKSHHFGTRLLQNFASI